MPSPTPPPGPSGLSERDISYLKLLKTLKTAGASGGGELGVVRRIATWIDSVPVLNFIASHASWYDDWEVKEGLLHNDLTPTRYRRELEKAIAIFELLREMDEPGLPAEERVEIQEDLRYLFKTLSDHDRGVVKQRAYELSASRSDKTPSAGPVAGVVETAEAPPPPSPATSSALLAQELEGIVPEAAEPVEGTVTQAIRQAEEEAWARLEFGAATTPAEGVAEPDTAEPVEAAAAATEAEPVDEEVVAEEGVSAAAPMEPEATEVAEPGAGDAAEAPGLADLVPERRAELAGSSADPAVLGALAHDRSEGVQLALLQNPALAEGQAVILARHAGPRAAAAIHRNRRLFMRPAIQRALLECPHAPSAALLEIVNSLSQLGELMSLIQSPKVKFLEVKAKARSRLSMIFRSLGVGEKVAAIRRAGRRILKELWSDFFRDEQLVLRCLQERQVDEGIVHEIARSRVAPRRALELIGKNPAWTNNYQIRLDLVMNPKTPRQVVARLVQKLKPADRKMLKNNPALPESIRRMA